MRRLPKKSFMVFSMKKFIIITFCVFLSFLLSACGGPNVSKEEISNYISDCYFLDRNMTISELKDVLISQGETENRALVSCTTVASNQFAEQIANWTMEFEKFNNSWVGVELKKTHTETNLNNFLSEEDLANVVCEPYLPSAYFYFSDIEVLPENETAIAHCTLYTNRWAFYTKQEGDVILNWDPYSMGWVQEDFIDWDPEITAVITSDISTHFEKSDSNHYEVFDIEKNPDLLDSFLIKNYYCAYNTHNPWGSIFSRRQLKYQMNDQTLNFAYDHNVLEATYKLEDSEYSEESKIKFTIENDKLKYDGPYHKYEILTLPKGNFDVNSFGVTLWQGTYQG